MGNVQYEIKQHLFSLQSSGKFHKELNLISWNGRDPVYDLRGWNDDHTEMTKGVTLSEDEYKELINLLKEE